MINKEFTVGEADTRYRSSASSCFRFLAEEVCARKMKGWIFSFIPCFFLVFLEEEGGRYE